MSCPSFFLSLPLEGITFSLKTSVGDPDPDLHVFGPPGSGSISQRYGSGSGSGSFLRLEIYLPAGKLKEKNIGKIFSGILKVPEERSRIRIRTKMSQIPNTALNSTDITSALLPVIAVIFIVHTYTRPICLLFF